MTSEFEYDDSSLDDDQLAMLFACCHPALAPEARMALTLRSVAGLTVPEIARAFLSSEVAMERRLGRARRKVTDARIPVSVPTDDLLPERLAGVLRVVYLIYTEGHGAVRGDLCEEAIRLARLLGAADAGRERGARAARAAAADRRAAGGADGRRRAGRAAGAGPLAVGRGADRGGAGADRRDYVPTHPVRIQAAISALHSTAPSWEATDWPQIAALYAELQRYDGSPVVAVNRAVAVGFADGPRAGLALLDAAARDERLARYQPLHAAGRSC
jgi:RNA polymerase sigma-70 factor (ECF subfamily)